VGRGAPAVFHGHDVTLPVPAGASRSPARVGSSSAVRSGGRVAPGETVDVAGDPPRLFDPDAGRLVRRATSTST
jgi:hypothetical protein